MVDEVIEESGVRERRQRLLTSRLMVYYVLSSRLFTERGTTAWSALIDGLSWAACGRAGWLPPADTPAPAASSLSEARARLGPDPFRLLFERGCRTAAAHPAAGLAGVSVGELAVEAPEARLRVRVLARCDTHAVLDAAVEPGADGSIPQPSGPVAVPRFADRMLVISDGSVDDTTRRAATAAGARLLWPADSTVPAGRGRPLRDGSLLIEAAAGTSRQDRGFGIRVISDGAVRLATTAVDPREASREQLLRAYDDRWRVSALDGVFPDAPTMISRARTESGLMQELYATFCVYQAVHPCGNGGSGAHPPMR